MAVKRQGGKYEIGFVVFQCDKCGNKEIYRQVRGGFVKVDNINEQQQEQKQEQVKQITTEQKQEQQKKILWFNV